MTSKNAKTFNSQVFTLTCKRLKLKRREKTILYRLLGFLIRNDKPFPYTINSLSEITGYSESSIYECLNLLEQSRLIERIGFTSRVKFQKGRILKRICTLVQKRTNNELIKNSTPVQILDKIPSASPESGYQKTYLSLKLKERGLTQIQLQQLEWYLKNPHIKVREEDRFLFDDGHANIIK